MNNDLHEGDPAGGVETYLRCLIQQELQAVLKLAESSPLIQETIRKIAREEVEAALTRQTHHYAAKVGRRS